MHGLYEKLFVHRNENNIDIVCVNKEFKGTSKPK